MSMQWLNQVNDKIKGRDVLLKVFSVSNTSALEMISRDEVSEMMDVEFETATDVGHASEESSCKTELESVKALLTALDDIDNVTALLTVSVLAMLCSYDQSICCVTILRR